MKNEIVVIRALWGDSEPSIKEVLPKPVFENEVVYVWGIGNKELLDSRGYKTVLVDEEITDPNYSSRETQFYHKLLVLQKAQETFNEFIFLDWDCYLLRPLDQHFYDCLRSGNDVQVPTYAYDDAKYAGMPKLIMFPANKRYKSGMNESLRLYLLEQEVQLRKYSWKQDGLLISPNFCFFYTRRPNIGSELLKVALDNNVRNCIEEHAMYLWANCSLDEYIKKYEPKIVQGISDETRTLLYKYKYWDDPVFKINNYISKMVDKIIYLKHI